MPAAVKDSPNKIFVSNLPRTWDEGKMEELFVNYGKISQVNLMKNKESGESRGFGFITFESADDANDAIQGMNGKEIEGVQLKVDGALKSLHSSGGPGGERGGRGGFRGRGGPPRGRGGPLLRGGPMGGFSPRGGPRGGFMPRGRGGPYSRGGMGGDRESGYEGGPPSRGMGRGRFDGPPRGGPAGRGPPRGGPRGAPRGGMRGAPRGGPRGGPRGRGGPGRPLIDRPPMEEMEQDSGYNAPRGNRTLLEPLLQDPGAPEYRQAREPMGRPAERASEGYRSGGFSDGGLLPTRQAQWDSAPVRREQEPLMREREARAPPQMERLTAERPRSAYPTEREATYGGRGGGAATAAAQYGEESYGGGARGAAAGRGGGGREEFGQSRGAGGASTFDYAESRPARAEYGAAATPDPLFRPRDPYGATSSDPAPARQTRDSYMERDYAPPARSADPYAAATSAAASRGYGAREPALPRDTQLPREAPRGRDAVPPRDYAPPARGAQRDYAETRREETVRDYARGGARGGFTEERAPASFSSRTYDDYEKASSRGYGAASESYGSARDPAGSSSSSRSAYASRDPYPSGRGDRAEKPGYGDPYRSAPQSSYGGRSAPTDRNGGGGRPYSRY